MKKIILINIIILLSIYLYGQKGRFSAGLLFSPEIKWYEDKENNKNYALISDMEYLLNLKLMIIYIYKVA